MRALFWISAALIAWTQALYAPALALCAGSRARRRPRPARRRHPSVRLIVAAYKEEAVIAAKVANALALD